MTTPTITPSAIQQQLHKAQALDSDNMTQVCHARFRVVRTLLTLCGLST